MKISLAYSPCPNDTFMFDAMVNQKIDTEGLSFEVSLKDVEALNNDAFKNIYDVSKVIQTYLLHFVHYDKRNL